MKASLRPGCLKGKRIMVDTDRTIGFMGEGGRVYGTPYFVRDIEYPCRDLSLEHADAGEDSVGMEVSLLHLAPTRLGMNVDTTATIMPIEGRKVSFAVSAKDELEQICEGMHARFVVEVERTLERLKVKAVKRPGVPSD